MSKLLQPIPKQSFELIRDRIGEILVDELAKQLTLQPAEIVLGAKVVPERHTQFNSDETPAVSVMYVTSNFDNHDVQESDGGNVYHIDCYTDGKASDGKRGDADSKLQLTRLLGVIRQILSSPHYVTLGFTPGFIKSRRVVNITISEPEEEEDAKNIMMGRLVFHVDAHEFSEDIVPTNLTSYCTTVNLYNTSQGYMYKALEHVYEGDVYEPDVYH